MRKILLIPGAMAILSMPLMSLSACSKQSEPEQPFDAEHCLRFTTRSDEAHLSLKDSTHGEVQVIVPDLYYSFDEGLTKHKYNFSSNNRENIVIPKNSSIIFWGNNPPRIFKIDKLWWLL